MVHTVYVDDATTAGRRFMSDYRRKRKGIEFNNPAITGIVPEGYITGDEFWGYVKERVTKHYKENGLL
jgi:hypothetical protein